MVQTNEQSNNTKYACASIRTAYLVIVLHAPTGLFLYY
jgi:hypothetical protein